MCISLELAVLSAVAHGSDPDTAKAVRIALAAEAALLGIDAELSTLYSDMLFDALSEAARLDRIGERLLTAASLGDALDLS